MNFFIKNIGNNLLKMENKIFITMFTGIGGYMYYNNDEIYERINSKHNQFNEERMRNTLTTLANDPKFRKQITDILVKIIEDEEVNNSLKKSVKNVINDTEINKETEKKIKELIWKSIKLW